MASFIRQKLSNFKTNHLSALASELVHKSSTDFYADGFLSTLKSEDAPTIVERILAYWSDEQIERAHSTVVARYRQGQRYYKKGRSFGAKNRSSTRIENDEQAIDALEELSKALEETESPLNMNYTTTPAAREPEVKINITPEQQQGLDTLKIREMIAENMKEFIAAYGRDKDLLTQTLKESLTIFETELQKSMDKRFNELKPNLIEIVRHELPPLELGVQHKTFATLLKMASATLRNGMHNNIWIYGPAGTGKSTAAEMVAKALNLSYYTDGKMADETKVLGYQDANGTYRSTNFRKAFEFGGIYLADEIDGSMPDALLALNGALANGHCSFPDKTVARHADFIFLAAANTTGQGGTIEYVGRFKQDAAFNDRFVFLKWDLDEALEDSLIANKDWLRQVRHVRNRIAQSTVKGHLITPRASIYGESLLASGLDMQYVIDSVLRKGLTDTQWGMVK